MRDRILEAVRTAIEGQKWLRYKWEGEYGSEYSADIRKNRIASINDEINKLGELRDEIKGGAKL